MRSGFALAGLLLLSGCGGGGDRAGDEPGGRALAASAAKAEDDGRIECAPGGQERFERVCALERVAGPDGLTLTLRNPDGGFRRLLVTGDGRGVIAADGAEPAQVEIISENRIEVAIGGDRYRLPATVQGR